MSKCSNCGEVIETKIILSCACGTFCDENCLHKFHKNEQTINKIELSKNVNLLRETFGTAKSKKSVKQMMKEMDKELYDI